MPRLLIWNIDEFSAAKINFLNEDGQRTLDHILTHIERLNPDIFVVLEVIAGRNQLGSILPSPGARIGATNLLTQINTRFAPDQWSLVPPLQIDTAGGNAPYGGEGIAVYYKRTGTNLIFTGPNIWPGGADGISSDPATGVAPGNYAAPFNDVLPADLVPNTNQILHNRNIPQSQCAGRATGFTNLHGFPLNFANVNRAPFMISFAQGPGPLYQNFTFFFVHGPNNNTRSRQNLLKLAQTREITTPNAPNEARIVAGDFNNNLFTVQNGNRQLSQGYRPALADAPPSLIDRNYNLILSPGPTPPNPPPAPPPAGRNDPQRNYYGYFTTQISTVDGAGFFTLPARGVSNYPGYVYLGRKPTLDNIFVRYPGAPPANNNFTIINSVVGTPLNKTDTPTNQTNAPLGNLPFNSLMSTANELAENFATPEVNFINPAPNIEAADDQRETQLLQPDNYAGIRTTSDHFALVIDL